MERNKSIRTAVAACVLSLTLSVASPARIIYVDDDAPADFRTIQAAIDDANDGDTVIVRPGTYAGLGNRDIDFRGKAITVTGTDPNDWDVVRRTVVDCGGTVKEPHRAFLIPSSEGGPSVLRGISITGGNVPEDGGAIRCDPGSSLTVTDCRLWQNRAGRRGGAIYCGSYCEIVTRGCLVEQNRAERGGGIYGDEHSGTRMENCDLRGNVAFTFGGAVYSCGAYFEPGPVITACRISGNCAERGGAVSLDRSDATVSNCVLDGNMTMDAGGAIYCHQASPSFTNCTIVDNHAKRFGGAFAGAGAVTGRLVLFENCIIWGNSAPEGDAIARGGCYVITGCPFVKITFCCLPADERAFAKGASYGWDVDLGRTCLSLDPLFMDGPNGDFRLQRDSPCIDRGTNSPANALPATDIEGITRVVDGDRDGVPQSDIGAHELPAPNGPYIRTSKVSLEFAIALDASQAEPQTLSLENLGLEALHWRIESDCNWLQVVPQEGVCGAAPTEVSVRVNATGLARGKFTGYLTISDPNASNNPQAVPVTLYLNQIRHVPGEYATVQEAIDAANPCDVVSLADGFYHGPGNEMLSFRGKPMTVRSDNGPENCILDCPEGKGGPESAFVFDQREDLRSILEALSMTGYLRAVDCNRSSPTMRNCQIHTAAQGTAIRLISSESIVQDCVIRGCINEVAQGRGIHLTSSDAVIRDCVIRDCSGAIMSQSSNVRVSGCTLSNNERALSCEWGALQLEQCDMSDNNQLGMSLFGMDVRITECRITGNGGSPLWPAVACWQGTIRLDRCTISGNHGPALGFYVCNGSVMKNCLVCGNGSRSADFAVVCSGGPLVMENCTLAENRRPAETVLPYDVLVLRYSSMVRVSDSIFSNDGNEIASDERSYIEVAFTDIRGGWSGTGNIEADPLFVRPGYWDPGIPDNPIDDFWVEGDYHLKSQAGRWETASGSWVVDEVTSPCLDAGDPNSPVGDEPQPNGGRVNMGAYGGTAEASKSYSGG